MKDEKDLVFNPKKYAEICEKQDRKARAERNRPHANFGSYYNENIVYGKVWEAVKEYGTTKEW